MFVCILLVRHFAVRTLQITKTHSTVTKLLLFNQSISFISGNEAHRKKEGKTAQFELPQKPMKLDKTD